jgi:hypothetical protein
MLTTSVILVDNDTDSLKVSAQYRADGFNSQSVWRISSGFQIKNIRREKVDYVITQKSGNSYFLRASEEGIGDFFMRSVLLDILEKHGNLTQVKFDDIYKQY